MFGNPVVFPIMRQLLSWKKPRYGGIALQEPLVQLKLRG
jgi:hypothetical protein